MTADQGAILAGAAAFILVIPACFLLFLILYVKSQRRAARAELQLAAATVKLEPVAAENEKVKAA